MWIADPDPGPGTFRRDVRISFFINRIDSFCLYNAARPRPIIGHRFSVGKNGTYCNNAHVQQKIRQFFLARKMGPIIGATNSLTWAGTAGRLRFQQIEAVCVFYKPIQK